MPCLRQYCLPERKEDGVSTRKMVEMPIVSCREKAKGVSEENWSEHSCTDACGWVEREGGAATKIKQQIKPSSLLLS